MCKEHSSRPDLQDVIALLDRSHEMLKAHKAHPIVNIEYLEGVARVRFALMHIASLLNSLCNSGIGLQPLEYELLELAKRVCMDPVINTTDFNASSIDVVGPAVYLLKLLVRQYGFSCLKSTSEQNSWVLPEGLHNTNQVHFHKKII